MTPATALAASLSVHVAALVVVGGHTLSQKSEATLREPTFYVELEPEALPIAPPELAATSLKSPSVPKPRSHTHHHNYPVRPDHSDRPHDARLAHAPMSADAAPPPTNVAALDALEPPPTHFTLPQGQVRPTRGMATSEGGGTPTFPTAALPEARVHVKARLLHRSPTQYPEPALRAEVERDVPLEIVVDELGRVTEARSLSASGYGLDEEALRTIRTYRFAPAHKDAKPVRVRMRWTVQFRLR